MTKLEKLPPLVPKHSPPDHADLLHITWPEVHLFKEQSWKRFVSAVFYVVLFGFLFFLNAWVVWKTKGFGHAGEMSGTRFLLTYFGPPAAVLIPIYVAAELLVLNSWRGGGVDEVQGFSGFTWAPTIGVAKINHQLQASFFRVSYKRFGERLTDRVDTALATIQGLILTSEYEWQGLPPPPAGYPNHFLIVLDLGTGGTFPICRHFGSKPQVAQLHAQLTQAFVAGRPKATQQVAPDDDPV